MNPESATSKKKISVGSNTKKLAKGRSGGVQILPNSSDRNKIAKSLIVEKKQTPSVGKFDGVKIVPRAQPAKRASFIGRFKKSEANRAILDRILSHESE